MTKHKTDFDRFVLGVGDLTILIRRPEIKAEAADRIAAERLSIAGLRTLREGIEEIFEKSASVRMGIRRP